MLTERTSMKVIPVTKAGGQARKGENSGTGAKVTSSVAIERKVTVIN